MYSSVLSPLSAEQREILLTDAPLLTLPAVFASIPDPRSKHGQRYDLPYLLLCLTAALLCNCNSTEAVGQWGREQHALLQRLFGPRRHLSPTAARYRRLLPRRSSHQIEWALARSRSCHLNRSFRRCRGARWENGAWSCFTRTGRSPSAGILHPWKPGNGAPSARQRAD